MAGYERKQLIKDRILDYIMTAAGVLSLMAAVSAAVFILLRGIPQLFTWGSAELFGMRWAPSDIPPSFGLFPFITGTFWISVSTLFLSVPPAVLTAVYMIYFSRPGQEKYMLFITRFMAGVPAVVLGVMGVTSVVPFIHHWIGGTGSSILTASLTLSMMVMPTLCLGCRSAVLSVPWKYYQGARALGISHEKTVFLLMVPQAWRGILTAVLFSTGRIMGETLIVVMTAGNQAWMPDSWLDGVRTLTANIFLEMSYAPGDGGDPVLAAAAVLLIFIFAVQLLFSVMRRRCFPYGK